MGSDLHADVPSTPDDGAEVADGNAVAHAEDLLVVLTADRSRDKADAVDDVVALDVEGLSVRTLDGHAAVADGGDGGVQVGRNLVVLHRVTQEGGVGKAGGLCRDQVVRGIEFEMSGYITHLQKNYPGLLVFLTGGDEFSFDTKLKSIIFADRFLVLKGLNRILSYNDKL